LPIALRVGGLACERLASVVVAVRANQDTPHG
jgi:hypothetical protein